MTVDFCYEIQIVIPRATVDTVPIDFKLDNFMLRGANFQLFAPTFTKHL